MIGRFQYGARCIRGMLPDIAASHPCCDTATPIGAALNHVVAVFAGGMRKLQDPRHKHTQDQHCKQPLQ